MAIQKLRFVVRAAKGDEIGPPMVTVFERVRTHRNFVGLKHDPTLGPEQQSPDPGGGSFHPGGWVAHKHTDVHPETGAPLAYHEVPVNGHPEVLHAYLQELKAGTLLPADKFTAEYAGVPFDPTLKGAAMFAVDQPEEKGSTLAEVHSAVMKASNPSQTKTPPTPTPPTTKDGDK
jgi:hypothetical protein